MIKTLNTFMEHNGVGVIYVDEDLKIHAHNDIAEGFFNRNDGLSNKLETLCFDGKQRLLKLCRSTNQQISLYLDEYFYVSREDGKRPYLIKVIPFDAEDMTNSTNSRFIVLVFDLENNFKLLENVFSEYYQLTPKELSLVKGIVSGMSLQRYANQVGVKMSTVRWTLNNVFSKTNTHTQAALVSLTLNFSAPII